jgi:hypothetical protein
MEVQYVNVRVCLDLTEPYAAVLLRILELSHEALVTGIVTTKRFPNSLIVSMSPWCTEAC